MREKLRDFLKEGEGRLDWLSNRTKLKKATIYNYCSTQPISESNAVLLEYAITEYEKLRAQEDKNSVDVDISEEDREIIEKYASEAKMKIEDLVSFLLEKKISG